MKIDEINYSSELAIGNKAFRFGDYETAVLHFEKALIERPDLKDFLAFNLSMAKSKTRKKSNNIKNNTILPVVDRDIDYYSKEYPASNYLMNHQVYTVDIVIPVYNALEDVQLCLESIEKNTDGFRVTTYVVNDASDKETTDFLRSFCKNKSNYVLIEHEKNMMYTRTVNDGLRASKSDYVITLNSDTIVTKGWLQGLVRCMRSDSKIGVVGPLSNAASWQNVPELLDENKQFAVNDIPNNMTTDQMAEYVNKVSHHVYPRVPFVNGFCFMISRDVINKIGYLDEETFPTGYGEENDYCLRVADAGFTLAIADDAYVFHAKSKSFGHEKRKEYSKNGSAALKAKHGKEKVNNLGGYIRDMKIFDEIRQRVKDGLNPDTELKAKDPFRQRILFLLPVSGGGGGVHSIVQETMGMRRIGVQAKIAVPKKHRPKFIKKYEDINVVEDLFIGFETHELGEISKKFDVIVGTIYTSMKLVGEVMKINPGIQPAYYVQDYEPLFSEPGTPAWQEARDSYTLVPNAILFAKTDWICQKVYDEHGVRVKKVSPSIDHDVYKLDPLAKKQAGLENKIVISAMIRPKTPRRGAERTMRLLKRVYEQLGSKVHIELFGCAEDDPLFQNLERNFKYNNNGELTRLGVAAVLQRSDCFIDLSDYQAFGRTGLEAMACGVVLLSTKFGGIYEYIIPSENAFVTDPFNDDHTYSKLLTIITNKEKLKPIKNNSLITSADYSIHKAALTEIISL